MEPIRTPGLERYLGMVAAYDGEFAKWQARVKKILKRYRDDTRGQSGNETAKFNILWSNVQTLIPAVYSKLPKADVSRRFGDNDPLSRVASNLIERAVDFEIEHYADFRSAMRHCVEDRFLGGRGTAWVRYEPHLAPQGIDDDGLEVTDKIEEGEGEPERPEQIEYECAPIDYVHWRDFGHSAARTWEEVTCVWRWVYMGYDALVERFGEETAKKIPMSEGPEPLNAYNEQKKAYNKAKICELWDKETNKVYWFSKSLPDFIDERDDPLGLEEFFPCPKPLYATTTSDNLVPVPDFVLYQDQAVELDILSDRIDGLVKALRVRGVYDASQPALQRLLTEGDNNSLIPVDKWLAFGEKGGLKGSIDLLPLDTLAAALMQCYQARDNIKQQIYEITGISDIIRGASYASETATAQQIKGQYAGLRLRSMQEEVALFATALIRLKAQVICSKFQPQTIVAYSAASQMQPVDQQMVPQALQLLKDRPLRNFRIEVAADSLVQIDEQQMKQERMEFLNTYSNFMKQVLPIAQSMPVTAPMVIELMKYGVAAFKQARTIEGELDQTLDQFKQMAAQPPPPNPEMQKVQAQTQMDQAKLQQEAQIAQLKLQHDAQIEQMKAQFEAERIAREQEFERWKAELDANTKIVAARIAANPGIDIQQLEQTDQVVDRVMQNVNASVADAVNQMAAMHSQMADLHKQSTDHINNVVEVLKAPKRIIRGPDGRAVGVEAVQAAKTGPVLIQKPTRIQ